MIRRRVGDEFFLIAQHDHALLAGELARHCGNKLFDVPRELRESFVLGTALHDCGWPVHDDSPTLNAELFPIDVFESTPQIALKVWEASSQRATERGDDYAALLVSLHALSLSVNAVSPPSQKHEHFNMEDAKTRFEVNRFQHAQIELQESLRRKLGLSVDIPMRNGLAEQPQDLAEHRLHFHFRMLQAMDQISLALCCTKPPGNEISPVFVRPGGKSVTLTLKRDDQTLHVTPWPFDQEELRVGTPYRRIPAKPYQSDNDLRATYFATRAEQIDFDLLPG